MSNIFRDMSLDEIRSINFLELDDTIPFDCKICGKCCKNRHDLLLTPYDVFRLARYLTRTTEEIIISYCDDIYEGKDSRLPIVRILPRPPDASCPFLRDRKCAVHPAKPILCRVFPLSKVSNLLDEKSGYYLGELPNCKHGDDPITVREWVGNAASDESNSAAAEWLNSIKRIVPPFLEKFRELTLNQRSRIFKAMFANLYLNYDVKLGFAPQLRANTDALCAYMRELGVGEGGETEDSE